jgi:tetratricopeptide (TPR) repeat protein
VLNNLGNAELELGRYEESVLAFEQAQASAPTDADIASNLGNALRLQGRHEASLLACRRALELDPNLSAAHNNLGLALAQLGRRDEAIEAYRRALSLNSEDPHVLDNLGNALRDRGELTQAAGCFRAAIALRPDRGAAHLNLGNVLLDMGRIDEAGRSYARALELNPGDAAARLTLSMVLRRLGRAADAERCCRAALALKPASADTLAFLGELRADQGDFGEAQRLFERALSIDPTLSTAWAGIAAHRKMTTEDLAWLAGAEAALARRPALRHEIGLRHALGKYYDDVGRFDQAFENYRCANELTKRYGARYDREKFSRRIDSIIANLDADWLRREAEKGNSSERPLFIIGMPRSGTSLTEQILASHAQVFGAGELTYWEAAFARFEAAGMRGAEGHGADGLISTLAKEYLQQLDSLAPGATRIVDKLPWNFIHAGLIHAAFPRARIIHLTRHPADTCLSIYFQYFANTLPYANDLDDLVHYYGEYARLMQHWRSILPATTLLEIPYEGLVQDQEGWTRRLLDFVGLPWDSRCLQFHETQRSVTTTSKWQVRQKIHSSSTARWKNYRAFLGPLESLQSRS